MDNLQFLLIQLWYKFLLFAFFWFSSSDNILIRAISFIILNCTSNINKFYENYFSLIQSKKNKVQWKKNNAASLKFRNCVNYFK